MSTLTFTASNWDTSQTVTVTGVDDPTVDGSQATTTITVSVDDGNSIDDAFDSVADQTVSVTTVDVSTLTFTASNWDTSQTVTVTGVDDPAVDGSQANDYGVC